jgi:5-methylcytosine-specific restriction endonuclease McrA
MIESMISNFLQHAAGQKPENRMSKQALLALHLQRERIVKRNRKYKVTHIPHEKLKHTLLYFQDNVCFYCGVRFEGEIAPQLEHLHAKSVFGESEDPEHFVMACEWCNDIKGVTEFVPGTPKEEIRLKVRAMIRARYKELCNQEV